MAAAVLIAWPLIAMALFLGLGVVQGFIWVTLVGYLFLPEFGLELPGLPAYDKYMALSLSLLLGAIITSGRMSKPRLVDPGVKRIMWLLLVLLFAALLVTIVTNTNPLVRGGRFQAGHTLKDFASLSLNYMIALVPFLLAWRWLRDRGDHEKVLKAIVLVAMAYSLLVLFEWRMSPQLNSWIYGFFPHSWKQHIRGGGFRPIVFLSHGLAVGFFLLVATLSAVTLARSQAEPQKRTLYIAAAVWLFFVLFMSRNMGATMLAMLFVPLLFTTRRTIVLAVTVVSLLFILYPVARQAQLLPINQFASFVEGLSPDRAASFVHRLRNEEALLQRAAEKPVFGWGGWGRSRVIDEDGQDLSTTDGTWIIQLGQFGWAGYIGFFGLITAPLLLLRRRQAELPFESIGIAVIMAANLIYLIPNSTFSPLSWLFVGALASIMQYGRGQAAQSPEQTAGPTRRPVAYTRFPAQTKA